MEEALAFAREQIQAHPDRDLGAAKEAALAGRRRRYPVININSGDSSPLPEEFQLDPVIPDLQMPPSPAADLARDVLNGLRPLHQGNPAGIGFGAGGRGTGTFATLFGIPLNPELNNAPAFTLSMDELLKAPHPDVPNAGLMPEMRARIELIRHHVPAGVPIGLPDIQGPFNVAHMLAGEEVFYGALTDPDTYHRFMDRVTGVWIEAVQTLLGWIGKEYENPSDRIPRLRECSVNLVSPEFYEEFILPYDLRVASVFPRLEVHPCTGRHVFEVTLKNLPVAQIEAGWMEGVCASFMPVEEALVRIGERPVVLMVFEELPPGLDGAWTVVKRHLDLYADHPRMLYSYFTKPHKLNRAMIRELRQRAETYWAERYSHDMD
jgi:hypothetical protein